MRHIDMFSQPGYLIRRLHQRSTAQFTAAAAGFDITQIQLSILLVLHDLPGTDATRIGELISSDRTTVRQALLLLEAKGLIRRSPGIEDRRTKRLEITEAGARMADQVAACVFDLDRAIFAPLAPRERVTMMRLLTKLSAAT